MDSEYRDNEQQNFAIKTITCVVAVLGAICVFTLLYIGIRLLSNDSMGSSPASKLNRSDDSGHIMIGGGGGGQASSPEGKLLTMEPKYYIQAGTGSHPGTISGLPAAKNLFATNMSPTTVYQPLANSIAAVQQQQQKNERDSGEKLSALDYHLLAPQLVSKLEKGGGNCSSGEDESASDRLLKPMISGSCRNNSGKSKRGSNNNRTTNSAAEECNCNLAKNCRNCCSTKFTNERWQGKDNRHK